MYSVHCVTMCKRQIETLYSSTTTKRTFRYRIGNVSDFRNNNNNPLTPDLYAMDLTILPGNDIPIIKKANKSERG